MAVEGRDLGKRSFDNLVQSTTARESPGAFYRKRRRDRGMDAKGGKVCRRQCRVWWPET